MKMENKGRKIKTAFLCIAFLCFAAVMTFAACGEKKEATLIAETHSVSIEEGETIALSVTYDGEEKLLWMSGDKNIATVDNGTVTGIAEGRTVITVSAGELSESIEVAVIGRDVSLVNVSFVTDRYILYTGDAVTTKLSAEYKGNEVPCENISYVSSDDEIAAVGADGTVTAVREGYVTVSVFADVYGETFIRSLNYKVEKDYSVKAENINLKTLASFNGETYVNSSEPDITVYKRGEVLSESYSAEYSSENEAVAVADASGTITAVNSGETIIHFTVSVEGIDVAEGSFMVVVEKISVDLTDKRLVIEAGSEYALTEVEGLSGITVLSAEVSVNGVRTEAEVGAENSVILPAVASGFDRVLYVYSDKVDFMFKADVFVAIADEEDMNVLKSAFDGYYKLVADIDMSGVEWKYGSTVTFGGTFDGQEHKIAGLSVAGNINGLFANVSDGAVIQNVHFENAVISGTSEHVGGVIFKWFNGKPTDTVTVENVTATVIMRQTNVNGGLFGIVGGKVIMKDVTATVYEKTGNSAKYGALCGRCGGSFVFENVKVYSNLPLCSTYNHELNSEYNKVNSAVGVLAVPVEGKLNLGDASPSFAFGTEGVAYTAYCGTAVHEGTGSAYLPDTDNTGGIAAGEYILVVAMDGGDTIVYKLAVEIKKYISQDNITELLTATSGDYYLTEDIDMTGITWAPTKAFSGTLDGCGFAIKNLVTSKGLFSTLNGTVRNLALIDVNVRDGAGALAYQVGSASAEIENLIVTVSDFGANYYVGGLFRVIQSCNVTLKNVMVSVPDKGATGTRTNGFIAGMCQSVRSVTADNCFFITANETFLPIGLRPEGTWIADADTSVAALKGEYHIYSSFAEMENDAEGFSTLTEELTLMYNKYL